MKKVIILRKAHAKKKSFTSPFSSLERNIPHLSCQFITYSIRIGHLDWCNTRNIHWRYSVKKGVP